MTFQYARRRRHIALAGNPFKGDYMVIDGAYQTKNWNRFWYPFTAEYVYSIRSIVGDRITTEVVETLPRGDRKYTGARYEHYIRDMIGIICYEGTTTLVTMEDFEEFKKRL